MAKFKKNLSLLFMLCLMLAALSMGVLAAGEGEPEDASPVFTLMDGDYVLEANMTLGSNQVISSNLIIDKNAALSLNGYTLTVEGNVIVHNGRLLIGSGTLNVKGDLRIQSMTKNEDGSVTYGASSGTLYMSQGCNGVLNVDGDFITQSNLSCSSNSDCNYYGSGNTINLKGNLTQLAGGSIQRNFVCYSNVVLRGNDKQIISLENYPNSKLTTLALTQPVSNYEFNPNPCWDTLTFVDVKSAELSFPVFQDSGTSGTLNCEVFCAPDMEGKTATGIAAFYDEQNQMLATWVQTDFVLQEKVTLKLSGDIPAGYCAVKLFLLDGVTCAPLCEAGEVAVSQ